MKVNAIVPELKFLLTVKQRSAPLLGETINPIEAKVIDDDSVEKISWEIEYLHFHNDRVEVELNQRDGTAVAKGRTKTWEYEYTLQPVLVIGDRRFLLGREI